MEQIVYSVCKCCQSYGFVTK